MTTSPSPRCGLTALARIAPNPMNGVCAMMATTIRKLAKSDNETRMQREVRRWINGQAREYDNGVAGVLRDLAYGGCASGYVSGMICYADTLAFFREHRKEIASLLAETLADFGGTVSQLFGDKWDDSDPLAEETQNQNLLAWFAWEETARALGQSAGIDV